MADVWIVAVPAFLTAAAVVLVPGLIVTVAGFGTRTIAPHLLAPALSVAMVAVAANIAPVVGLQWTLIPLVIVVVGAGIGAWFLRRWVRDPASGRVPARRLLALGVGVGVAIVALLAQLTSVFGNPDWISQTFDNVIHLSAVRYALELSDASASAVGAASDIGFYPNTWHALVTLVAQTAGADVPLAVNATNLAIGAVVWPMSVVALSAVIFRERPAALIASGALSTGFGAFPLLLLYFGVLYPNALGFAVLPAGVAGVILLLRARGAATLTRASVVVLALALGIALSHPNAFLALYAFATFTTIAVVLDRALVARNRATWVLWGVSTTALLVGGAVLWRVGRTGSVMSQWGAWQSTAQAFGEAALIAPRGYPITLVSAALLIIGAIAIARAPRRLLTVYMPFLIAAFMFILASGVPAGTFFRDMVTNPWYNDPYRLAALLPVAGIPIAVLGAITAFDAIATLVRASTWGQVAAAAGVVAATAAVFSVAVGPNVVATMDDARASYEVTADAPLLSADELALLERLESTTPDDAVIVANPWTGGSLAFALAGREVLERHVFVVRSDDEIFIDENLASIDEDPRVCSALDRLGADYVLDFGDRNVWSRPDVGGERAGLNNLPDSPHLVLVDSEGPSARLFRVEGC
tara:strand:- start:4935 stop:6863 length:1929 start_codon:yes stop_codon:yes gene_type:complete